MSSIHSEEPSRGCTDFATDSLPEITALIATISCLSETPDDGKKGEKGGRRKKAESLDKRLSRPHFKVHEMTSCTFPTKQANKQASKPAFVARTVQLLFILGQFRTPAQLFAACGYAGTGL